MTHNIDNIGTWSAEVDNSGKTPFIKVNGTFPTNGEKPVFHLRRNEPQGINNSELLLTLVFGNLADTSGAIDVTVAYSEFFMTTDKYKTVTIVDEDSRTIASINVLSRQYLNIGQWSAEIDNSGKTPLLFINGTFPTNGEKPMFHLRKNEPQGINSSELLLTLAFGTLATAHGKVNVTVGYSKLLVIVDEYRTVLIVDENNRKVASIVVAGQ